VALATWPQVGRAGMCCCRLCVSLLCCMACGRTTMQISPSTTSTCREEGPKRHPGVSPNVPRLSQQAQPLRQGGLERLKRAVTQSKLPCARCGLPWLGQHGTWLYGRQWRQQCEPAQLQDGHVFGGSELGQTLTQPCLCCYGATPSNGAQPMSTVLRHSWVEGTPEVYAHAGWPHVFRMPGVRSQGRGWAS
jgi:hypothetical protein